jgi:hypothetical protein
MFRNCLLFCVISALSICSCTRTTTDTPEPASGANPNPWAVNLTGGVWVVHMYADSVITDTVLVNDTLRFIDQENYTWNDSAGTYSGAYQRYGDRTNLTLTNTPYGDTLSTNNQGTSCPCFDANGQVNGQRFMCMSDYRYLYFWIEKL